MQFKTKMIRMNMDVHCLSCWSHDNVQIQALTASDEEKQLVVPQSKPFKQKMDQNQENNQRYILGNWQTQQLKD